jgi:hypothetical protein
MYIIVDDERMPTDITWVRLPKTLPNNQSWQVCRSYNGFVKLLESLKDGEVPTLISFDHDLGHVPNEGERERTGLSCARAMLCIAQDKHWPHLPKILVHSQNPVGKKNIEGTIKSGEKWIGGGTSVR